MGQGIQKLEKEKNKLQDRIKEIDSFIKKHEQKLKEKELLKYNEKFYMVCSYDSCSNLQIFYLNSIDIHAFKLYGIKIKYNPYSLNEYNIAPFCCNVNELYPSREIIEIGKDLFMKHYKEVQRRIDNDLQIKQ